jgi:hypothetical protein
LLTEVLGAKKLRRVLEKKVEKEQLTRRGFERFADDFLGCLDRVLMSAGALMLYHIVD